MSLFLSAETGLNHNGSLEIAKRMILEAKVAGMDAVKFQKRTIDECYTKEFLGSPRTSPWGITQRAQKEGLEFGFDQYRVIDAYCRDLGILWYASAWDLQSLQFLRQFSMPHNKIASPMLGHKPLLREVASEGIHAFISTGMSTLEEIDDAVDIFLKLNCPFSLMHCNSTYPLPDEDANLLCIPLLKQRYGVPVGYCVVPETRVLTKDLRWIQAGDLKIGDELVGFDEKLGMKMKMRTAVVTGSRVLSLPCHIVHTDRGSITASAEHRFITSRLFLRNYPNGVRGGNWLSHWVKTQDLKKGDPLRHFVSPWNEETSYDAGWLAGVFDGEGWVSNRRVSVAQNPGLILDTLESMLIERGYHVSPRRPDKRTNKQCMSMEIGGRRETMRFLGSIRPKRLLAKSAKVWEGSRAWSNDSRCNVQEIEYVGRHEVIALTTSTGTLITEGFMSHNSGHETSTIKVCVAAVALGATSIERHITLNRTMYGSDQAASMECHDLKNFVDVIRAVPKILGDGKKEICASEWPVRKKLRVEVA